MTYTLHPDAEKDLREAADFYRKSAGFELSESFLAEFERQLSLLLTHPQLGTVSGRNKRSFLMKRFPFSIVYIETTDNVHVLAVAHNSRRPGYWRRRK